MSNAEKVYAPPKVLSGTEIPAGVLNYLNGEDLLSKTQALRISTVDPDGWPKTALLSAGDVLALSDGRIRFAVFAGSGTAANLERDGRITLGLALDKGMCSVRMRAQKCGAMADLSLTFFEGKVERVRMHVAAYADVTAGITFAPHEPAALLERWNREIAALRVVSL